MSTAIFAWAVLATVVAVIALWNVVKLRHRERYLTAVLEGTK